MKLLMVGTSHQAADVALREKLAVSDGQMLGAYASLQAAFPDAEFVVLSTCNRTELYTAKATHEHPRAEDLRAWLAQRGDVPLDRVTAATIEREQHGAAQHLMRVATGLESRMLGEPQVLGQVRRAYELAADRGAVGPTLHRVFQQALATAKRLRTRTAIGTGRSSEGTVAIDFARRVFDGFGDKTIVTIGAGEMIDAVLPHLRALSPKRLWLLNRTTERAVALAARHRVDPTAGGARGWDDRATVLREADFVVSCTAAPVALFDARGLKPIIKARRYRPLCVADLGVPRDFDPAVGSLRNVYLHNIDDLQRVVAGQQDTDRESARQCEAEIIAVARATLSQVQHRDLGVLIRALRSKLHAIGEAEAERTVRRLGHTGSATPDADAEAERLIRDHTRRMINKLLHLPLEQLNQHDGDAPLGFYAAALRKLFDLDTPTDVMPPEDEADATPAPDRATEQR